jgi:hypothetical protein
MNSPTLPIFAVEAQWMWRELSPARYSRIAWNEVSESTN